MGQPNTSGFHTHSFFSHLIKWRIFFPKQNTQEAVFLWASLLQVYILLSIFQYAQKPIMGKNPSGHLLSAILHFGQKEVQRGQDLPKVTKLEWIEVTKKKWIG